MEVSMPRAGRGKLKKRERALRRMGLSSDGPGWVGTVSARKYGKIKAYCEANGVTLKLCNSFAERAPGARTAFLASHRPLLGLYFCSYCGKLLGRRSLVVDHLYPVDAAKGSLRLQKRLRRRGLKSINDPRNLVPACAGCNRRKGAKTGLWVLRGQIGRHPSVWALRWTARAALAVTAAMLLARLACPPA